MDKKKAPKSLIPLPVGLSFSTLPLLMLLSAAKSLGESIEGAGKLGEEIFRGERLPLLSFPKSDRTGEIADGD
jgi:hypothetical protein